MTIGSSKARYSIDFFPCNLLKAEEHMGKNCKFYTKMIEQIFQYIVVVETTEKCFCPLSKIDVKR